MPIGVSTFIVSESSLKPKTFAKKSKYLKYSSIPIPDINEIDRYILRVFRFSVPLICLATKKSITPITPKRSTNKPDNL